MASAQGFVDAVVEEMEEDVALLHPSGNDVQAYEDAAVAFAIDAVAVDEADAWGFHKDGYLAPVGLALAEGDVIGSCRYHVLTVLCGVADVVSVDGECAVAGNLIYLAAMKMYFQHILLCIDFFVGVGYVPNFVYPLSLFPFVDDLPCC